MKSIQYHKGLIIVYSFVLVLLIFLILTFAPRIPVLSIVLFEVFVLFFILALSFYKLTISVSDDYVAFSFGIGLVKKIYNLREIKNCIPVKGKFSIYSRISFEKLPNGGKAYVLSSAFSSVEIIYKKKNGSICSDRVGTDKPKEIADYINKRIAFVNGILNTR